MTIKSILLAIAEPQALIDVTQALGAAWEVTSVASEEDALAQLEQKSFNALLVDFNLGSDDASELLNQALEKQPTAIRFLLAHEADLALVAAKVLGSHQILPKPIEPVSLKARLEEAVNETSSDQSESAEPRSVNEAPAVPPVYAEVLKAIESPHATTEQVGKLIGQDGALSAELFRLTNSAYLGLPRNITDSVEAVESLGMEAVKALVLAQQFLAEHSRVRPGYISFDQIWEHSVNVAQIARDLVLFETKDRGLASQALIAGLVHDLGKIVLVTNFDDLYGRVYSLARKQPVALWDIEKEMFGANHGEIGACLIGMWNLPASIVEATALHHEPSLADSQGLTALAAVHIANVLERELRTDGEEMTVAPIINTPFLNELGLLQRLPIWRAAFANRRAEGFAAETESTEMDTLESAVVEATVSSRSANYLPGPAASTRTTSSNQSEVDVSTYRRRWAFAGFAAVVILLLAIWFSQQPELDKSEPIYARTEAHRPLPELPTPVAQPQTAPAPAPDLATVASEETPTSASTNSAAPTPLDPLPATEPATAAVTETAVTNTPPPILAPAEKPSPEFRVTGIIYTSHPSAIVNGETLNVGDELNGATVISIGRTTVTLQINGQRKTFHLR